MCIHTYVSVSIWMNRIKDRAMRLLAQAGRVLAQAEEVWQQHYKIKQIKTSYNKHCQEHQLNQRVQSLEPCCRRWGFLAW